MKYMGCAAHKINLIVEKGLDPVEDVLTKIKRIVNHFKSSTKSWNKLTECQSREGISPPKKLINSMPTRWNSAYYMVRRFVELETPIKMAIALITSDLPVLSSIEWTVCRSLCVVLKPIEEMIQMLSKQKYPPASSVIIMINGLMELLLELRKRPDLSSVVSVIDVLLEEIKKEERCIVPSRCFQIDAQVPEGLSGIGFVKGGEARQRKSTKGDVTSNMMGHRRVDLKSKLIH
ncbi:unnamed protein product [Nesidiocoris tenuis]|uniref:Zinc finger BED domain-containing protein 4 n=1 Tax=Nesidiocoris tenuis TaxID=355587 RepID=A0A6H5FW96_9HEMI|nr:unnamed protein product [Nesidiocoris tenuis]